MFISKLWKTLNQDIESVKVIKLVKILTGLTVGFVFYGILWHLALYLGSTFFTQSFYLNVYGTPLWDWGERISFILLEIIGVWITFKVIKLFKQRRDHRSTKAFENQGFTLLELLVVVTIIGVIAGIVIVSMSGGTESAKIAKGKSFAQQVHALLGWEIRGQWNFDENASGTAPGGKDIWDYSGYNNHGTIYGNPQWVKSQVEGYAFSFDGVDDYVSFVAKVIPLGAKSIEVWFQPKKINANKMILDNGVNEDTPYYGTSVLFNDSNRIIFTNVKGTAGEHNFRIGSVSPLSIDTWYHIVATWDGTTNSGKVKIYINGVVNNTGTAKAAETTESTSNLNIGRSANGVNYARMVFDEVRIYAEALPSAEIQKHYVQGLNKLLANNAITEEEYNQRITAFNQSLVQK